MAAALQRFRRLLPGLWAGWLLCVALVAAASPFATLATEAAGRVVARVLAHEAYSALLLGIVLLLLELHAGRQGGGSRDSRLNPAMLLCLGALFCTVAGYFALQPMMVAARSGGGAMSFGQLHALSAGFYLVKMGLVLALAWRAAGPSGPRPEPSS